MSMQNKKIMTHEKAYILEQERITSSTTSISIPISSKFGELLIKQKTKENSKNSSRVMQDRQRRLRQLRPEGSLVGISSAGPTRIT